MAYFHGLSIDDLCHGDHEWRNIQEVVRATFKIFYDTISAQSERIRALEADAETKATSAELKTVTRNLAELSVAIQTKAEVTDINAALSEKANKQTVDQALHKKANRVDVEEVLAKLDQKANVADVNSVLSRKADIETVSAQGERIRALAVDAETKATSGELKTVARNVAELSAAIQTKAEVADVNAALSEKANKQSVDQALHKKANRVEVDQVVAKLDDQKANVIDVNAVLSRKADVDTVNSVLATKASRTEVAELVDNKTHDLHTLLNKDIHLRATRSEMEQKAATVDVQSWLAQKVDRPEFLEATSTLAAKASRSGTELKSSIAELSKTADRQQRQVDELSESTRAGFQDISAELATKADKAETAAALQRKADNAATQAALDLKANSEDVRAALVTKADVSAVTDSLAGKASITDVNRALAHKANLEEVERKADVAIVEDVQKELAVRARIQDVCTLLDQKANIGDVNLALKEVNRELDSRALSTEVSKVAADQAMINESLVAEQCVGRWIWKTGKTKPSHAVPWNMQSCNTSPENFAWEKDKSHITIIAPGLYEISFGFFARKKPTVQLLVNGEPVLSAINTAAYVVHHSSGRLTSVGSHSAGSITGLTLIDFLALPPRARVSITYNGEDGAEGFMGLRKL